MGKKDRRPAKESRRRKGDQEFDDFDPGADDSQEFEDFDPIGDREAEPESLLQALADFGPSESQAKALVEACQEICRRLPAGGEERALAAAEDGVAGADNLVGVGIGEREVAGLPTGELAVRVFVKEKLKAGQVAEEALVPASVQGVPTDVDATGEIFAGRYTGRFRRAPCGVSVGNCERVMAGTLGCLVSRGRRLFLLSNNHVLALVNQGPVGARIPQPGRLDGGVCNRNVIARLTQWIPIAFGGAENFVDTALARTSPRRVDRRVLRPGGLRQSLVPPEVGPALQMRVQKSGRTTQYRRGVIDAVNVTVDVSFAPLGGIGRFVGQFRVRGSGAIFSDRGDSGSLVTTFPENHPVGLLFAGNAASNTTFCNPIRTVLTTLGVDIVY